MAIQYSVIRKINPQDLDAPKKYYANVVKRGFMGIEGLCERIAGSTSASKADVFLVLYALSMQLHQLLSEGYSVKLNGLGIFRVTLSGEGAKSSKEFNSHLIQRLYVRFLPDMALKKYISRTALEKVNT